MITETMEMLPSLAELLPPERILAGQIVQDWRAAIRLAGTLLLNSGAITADYIDAMIRSAEELNQYIVIAAGVALPHARPQEGALETAYSLVTLKEPIPFGHPTNDPVYLVFAFSATDKKVHVRAMKALANVLLSDTLVRNLQDASSPDEIHALIARVEAEINE